MFENLYSVTASASEQNVFNWKIRFDLQHQIYQVHFPGTPITPGACQLEIFRQLAEQALNSPASIAEVKNIKYLQVVDPISFPEVEVSESFSDQDESGLYKCNANIVCEGKILTKSVLILKSE